MYGYITVVDQVLYKTMKCWALCTLTVNFIQAPTIFLTLQHNWWHDISSYRYDNMLHLNVLCFANFCLFLACIAFIQMLLASIRLYKR